MKNKKVKFEDLGLCKREKYRLNNIILALEYVEESLSFCDYSQFAKKWGIFQKYYLCETIWDFMLKPLYISYHIEQQFFRKKQKI